ncbi:MAG: murein biosynthesis integral membrane protein MurJ [Deltaproteobacteria bacterium]|nr:murein biosynthesis integral membrane protein MurJ [Deltaproteobacteria bacterium]
MPDQKKRSTTLSAMIVMVCTFASRLLGFVRIALVSRYFGASGTVDVFNNIFAIPNSLRKLMAEGALSSAFIPELSKAIVDDQSGEKAKKLSRNILGFQLLVLVPLTIVSIIFAPYVVKVFVSFSEPEKILLSEKLFVWLINYSILISVSAVLMAVLNSHRRFLVPALTPLLYSVSVITSLVCFHEQFGIYAVVIGTLVGGLAQILFQLPFYKSLNYRILPSFAFKNDEFKRVLKQWFPILATSSIFAITHLVAVKIASSLSDGSVSALTNAIVFWQLPSGIFAASITTVLFPKLSREASKNDYRSMTDTVQYGIKALAILLIPSAFLFAVLGREIIALALLNGKFTPENTILTARVLVGYCAGMFILGVYNFSQRFFYSLRDYKTPFTAALVTLVLDIILSLILKNTFLEVAGLSWANTIAFTVGVIILVASMGKKTGFGLDWKDIFSTIIKTLISLFPAIIYIYILGRFTGRDWWMAGSSLSTFAYLFLYGIGSCLIILLMFNLLKVEFISIIKRKR